MKIFIQIGTNNGNDNFRKLVIKESPDLVLLVEQNKNIIETIKNNYINIKNVNIINKAVGYEDDVEVSLYIPSMNKYGNKGENNFTYHDVHFSLLPMNDWCEKENMIEIKTKSITFNTLCSNYNITEIDYLQIDTEGFYTEIIKMIDLDKINIKKIRYEKWGFDPSCFTKYHSDKYDKLGKNGLKIVEDKLIKYGYELNDINDSDGNDILAIKKIFYSQYKILNKNNNETIELINSKLFYTKNKDNYPPFKNGDYMEEYFLKYMINNNLKYDKNNRLYIPCLWTNFQIEDLFNEKKEEMQYILDNYILNNNCENGYFTIIQHDDGPKLKLPDNTLIYGACNGNIKLPLIYEDIENKLENIFKIKFNEKNILCSFIGTYTHNVRYILHNKFNNNKNFKLNVKNNWSSIVNDNDQNNFISTTVNSKFALAPRGYGKSSFRFFEILKLGTIPIYVWDDIEWLPYMDIIDYSNICISININNIDNLENILLNINEEKYNEMIQNYNNIKYIFGLEFMSKYIVTK